MREHRWFAVAELKDWHEPIFPADIGDMVEAAQATSCKS
jgi:hypothetical protein